MARKTPRRSARSSGTKFSMVSTHNKLEDTLKRLRQHKKTASRDELIGLIQRLIDDTDCGQDMLMEIGV